MSEFPALITDKLIAYEHLLTQDEEPLRVGITGAFRRGKSALIAALPPIEGIALIELPGYGGLDAPAIEDHAALWDGLRACDLVVFVFRCKLLPMHADEAVLRHLRDSDRWNYCLYTDQANADEMEDWLPLLAPNKSIDARDLEQALATLDHAEFRKNTLQPLRDEIESLFRDAEEHLELIGNPDTIMVRAERLTEQFLEWFRVVMARRVNSSKPQDLAARDAVHVIHNLLNETAANILNEFQVHAESVISDPTWLPELPSLPKPPGMIAVRVQSKGSEVSAFVAQAMRLAERHQPAIHDMLKTYAEQVIPQVEREVAQEREQLQALRERWHGLASSSR